MHVPAASIRFAPRLEELPGFIDLIEAFADEQELGPADSMAIALACEELFSNTVQHGEPSATAISLGLERVEDRVRVLYRDDAGAFDPTLQAEPDVSVAASERTMGGLGIQLIRKSMETFSYKRAQGENVVTFVRRLTKQAEAARPDGMLEENMNAEIEHVDGVPLIVLTGRLDTLAAPVLDAELAPLLATPRPRMLLDLAGVSYISSAGLRSILTLVKHTSRHGGRLGLVAIPPAIQEIIEISGFPSLMDLYPDRASALAGSKG